MSRFTWSSVLIAVLFSVLFFSGCYVPGPNKFGTDFFNPKGSNEGFTEKGNYIIKNDGTKVYGENIEPRYPIGKKKYFVKVDGKEYPTEDVKAYKLGQTYFYRAPSLNFYRRVVHGKVNVYAFTRESAMTSVDSRGHISTYYSTDTQYYCQKGDDGELTMINNMEDIKSILADCPLAVQTASVTTSEMRKKIKKDPNFLTNIFNVYNNNCAPLK